MCSLLFVGCFFGFSVQNGETLSAVAACRQQLLQVPVAIVVWMLGFGFGFGQWPLRCVCNIGAVAL